MVVLLQYDASERSESEANLKMKPAIFVSAAVLAGALALPAQADTRVFLGFQPFYPGYGSYYPGPRYIPPPRYSYYYEPAPPGFEPGYYEPEYDAPRIYRPPVRQKKQAKPATTKKAQPTVISCAKATKIVSGYGFSGVKSVNCKGQVYSFKATRDGSNFTVKLSSKNGELTEVKKL